MQAAKKGWLEAQEYKTPTTPRAKDIDPSKIKMHFFIK